MKRIEMADATESLSEYARKTGRETLVVTRNGKPVAALDRSGILLAGKIAALTASAATGYSLEKKEWIRLCYAGR